MSLEFRHGIELVRYYIGPKAIQTVSTAVIGLIGTAPVHLVAGPGKMAVNEPVLISSPEEAALHFGPETDGYTIPSALRAIFAQGAGTVMVINVFDPARHTAGGEPDPSLAAAADILPGIGPDGGRTGLRAFLDCKAKYGFGPKQLLAPAFTGFSGVIPAIAEIAGLLRAFAWIDAPPGLTYQQAIEARGGEGLLNTPSKHIGICYPHVKTTNASGETVLQGMSAFIAGAQAHKDLTVGFHHSASNTPLIGVTGLERPIYADPQDPSCEANLLNKAGIVTVFNGHATGFRTWGNRSASFPGSADPDNFICVHRTATIIEDSIAAFSLQYIDKPITDGLIDQLLLDINAYMAKLSGIGAVAEGSKAWYDPRLNPPQLKADGKLRICFSFLPPAPLEHLTYSSYLDISLAAGKES